MPGTARTPTIDDYKTEALTTLAAMTPAERARQQALNVLTNFGNTVTFGGVGALGDLARGTPLGTSGTQVRAQLDSQGSTGAISSGLGIIAPGAAIGKIAKAGVVAAGGIAPALAAVGRSFVPEVLGTRAAELGARAATPIGRTIAGFAAPLLAAGGISALAGNADTPAVVPVDPNVPLDGPHAGQTGGLRLTAGGPVETALATGRAAAPDPQRDLAKAVSAVLGKNPSIGDIQALGGLVPAAVKPGQTQRDMVFGNAYAQSKAIADATVAQLTADAAAGKITTEERDKEILKVAKSHFDQTAGLVGFNPVNMANAAILNGTTADAN